MKIEKGVSKKFVIDASVAVKWFHKEINTEKALSLLAHLRGGKIELYAPELLVYEVGNALGKGKKFPEGAITSAIDSLFESGISMFAVDRSIARFTAHLMCKHAITFYDALYGALAFSLGIPLITADPKDHERIKEITVIDLTALS